MPGPPTNRTPFWYRHSYHQPDSLQYYAPAQFLQAVPTPGGTGAGFSQPGSSQGSQLFADNSTPTNMNFMRDSRFNRQRVRPSSISDMQYSLDSSPASSVPSKSSYSGSGTDTGSSSVLRSESNTSSEISPLDQSCSSLPSHSGESTNLSADQDTHDAQIPVWKRNGKFVSFFRSFISPRTKEKEKVGMNRVFGLELTKLLADTGDEVPQVLRICSQLLEEKGIIDGIYRAPGISHNIQRIKNLFDEQRVPNLAGEPAVLHDIHCVSSVLKLYFRDLPTPLVTYDLYPHLVLASKQSELKRSEKFRDILQRLPAAHYRTMDWLMRHLNRMSQQADRTGMTSKNLAIVWSPNILRCDVSELDTQDALQDVGLQAVITEFLIRCAGTVFAPPSPSHHTAPSHCTHCCCHCTSTKPTNNNNNNNNNTVTFSTNVTTVGQGNLKPVLKNSESKNKTEIFISGNQTSQIREGVHNHTNSNGFQNRSTKVHQNGPSRSNRRFDSVSPVRLETGHFVRTQSGYQGRTNVGHHHVRAESAHQSRAETRINIVSRPRPRPVAVPNPSSSGLYSLEEVKLVSLPAKQTAELIDVKGEPIRPSVTFHTVLDRPVDRRSDFKPRRSGNWKNIFNIQNLNKPNSILSSQLEIRGSHREINIDEAILPENKPLNHRPRPRSEMNLSYSVQDSTLMLTPLKNNEFQVSTTNQFSFLPYHQNLINFNNNNNNNNKQQPFTRSNKLRQNFGKKAGSRPKSVDFEVLKSVENICRAQPTAYGPPGEDTGTGSDSIPQLRASQRLKDRLVGEWQNVRASRV